MINFEPQKLFGGAVSEGVHFSKSRPYQSYAHITAARGFAHMSDQLERTYVAQGKKMTVAEHSLHTSFVIYSIISSACFLEAKINELFADAADDDAWTDHTKTPTGIAPKDDRKNPAVVELPDEMIAAWRSAWKLDIPRTARYPILQKYQIALMLAQQELFDEGAAPYQDVAVLVQFRNYLVHAEPEWLIDIAPDPKLVTKKKLDKILEKRFELGPMHQTKSFPNKYLCSGCARWAVKSSTGFVDDFSRRVGRKERFEEASQFPLGYELVININSDLLLEQK